MIAAQANAQIGNYQNAIELISEAIKLTPENGETAFIAAIVYTLAGEKLSAITQIKHALNNDMGRMWFTLPWFKPLCDNRSFRDLMAPMTHDKTRTYGQIVCANE